MLVLPFIVGTVRGIQDMGARPVTIPLFATWMVGYFAYFAAGLWLKSRRRPRYVRPMVTYSAIAAACAVIVLLLDAALIVWVPAFLPFLAAGLWASAQRKERTVLSGGLLVVAASLMTVVAYAACRPAGSGAGWQVAAEAPTPVWALAVYLFAYFFGTVLYVKTMIRAHGRRSYLVASVTYHAAITVGAVAMALWHDPSWWLAAAVLAVLAARAWLMPSRSATPKAIGIGEIFSTVAVGVVALFLQ